MVHVHLEGYFCTVSPFNRINVVNRLDPRRTHIRRAILMIAHFSYSFNNVLLLCSLARLC